MAKILFLLQQGGGNVIQTIPAYLALKETHDIDLVYMPIYPTDSVSKCDIYPGDIKEVTPEEVRKIRKNYDWQINYPYGFLVNPQGSYVSDVLDNLNETDSEVTRDMQVCDFFGVKKDIKREWRSNERKGRFILIANGSLNVKEWAKKKYPMMANLVKLLKQKTDIPIASIGGKEEYVRGTVDLTGIPLLDTAGYMEKAHMCITTDTMAMHMAGLMEVPTVAVFTCTSETKNLDKEFHHSVKVVRNNIPCSPGQWGYHWHPECVVCANLRGYGFVPCQNVSPQKILGAVDLGKI